MVFLTEKEINEIENRLSDQGIRKYVYMGALNPEWVYFYQIMYEEKQYEKEHGKEEATIDTMLNEYEAKLEFLKRHENDPSSYEKAKSILGLK